MHAGRQPQNLIIREEKQMKLDELPLYDFEKLEIATNYFHFGNMLGKGGFGPVYKVILSKILYVLFCVIYHKSNINVYFTLLSRE
jgi:hypothetical protein